MYTILAQRISQHRGYTSVFIDFSTATTHYPVRRRLDYVPKYFALIISFLTPLTMNNWMSTRWYPRETSLVREEPFRRNVEIPSNVLFGEINSVRVNSSLLARFLVFGDARNIPLMIVRVVFIVLSYGLGDNRLSRYYSCAITNLRAAREEIRSRVCSVENQRTPNDLITHFYGTLSFTRLSFTDYCYDNYFIYTHGKAQ